MQVLLNLESRSWKRRQQLQNRMHWVRRFLEDLHFKMLVRGCKI